MKSYGLDSARNVGNWRGDGARVRIQGHGCYSRQVRGLRVGWMVIWVRRYVCRDCGHTMSRLPDWLHPWRWYAATIIIEALYRHLILQETAPSISARFRHDADAQQWRSLRRWRAQLLVSPTLWGWLGSRLGIRKPAESRQEGQHHLARLLGEMRIGKSGEKALDELARAVRSSLSGLQHNRRSAWLVMQFRAGISSGPDSGRAPRELPTEEGPGRGPPG